MSVSHIGMIGLGKMGHSIAANILKKGYTMTLYDIRPEAYADLLAIGAESAPTIAELGKRCDFVILMVNTFGQCLNCVNELVSTMDHGILEVSCTIEMKQVQELEKLVRKHGVHLLDAPVSGGTRGAESGTLTIMAAGREEVFETARPVLECFSQNVIHVGTCVGQGQAIKAINQLLVGINICAAAEAFNIARQCGLNLDLVFNTIKKSAGTSRIFENRGQFFINRDYSTRSTLAIQLKDTQIACHVASDAGAPAFLGNLCREFFERATGKYSPLQDSIAVIRLFEEMNTTNH